MITRRGFVKNVSVTALGVSFMLSLGSCRRSESRFEDSKDKGTEILSWVLIHPDNSVTVRVPQTELGQGVSTTIPQLIAEELELDWNSVKAEFYDPALNKARDNVYVWTATLGSASAHSLFEPTQIAAAQIRQMLIKAAANRWGAPEGELTAENSSVKSAKTGQSLSYAELAEDAAKISPPDPASIVPKKPKDREIIGKDIDRLDQAELSQGTIPYGIDFHLPNMRFAAIRQAPTFGGTLKQFKASSIGDAPGRPEIVHVKGAKVGYNSPVPEGEDPDLWAAAVHMDDAVAVIADSWWQAKSALEQLEIEWDAGEHHDFSSEKMRARLTKMVRGKLPVISESGNVEDALDKAAKQITAEYYYPFMEPAPLEPINCTALVDGGEVHVWTNSQFADDAWRIAHEVGGVDENSAHLHLLPAGGGFGRRLQNDFVHQAVQIAKAHQGTPIKLLWTREECTRHSYYAPLTVVGYQGGLDSSGSLSAWHCKVASGASADQAYGANSFPFRADNIRLEYKRDMTTPVPFGWMRGVGFTQHLWMNFSFLDELRELSGHSVIDFYRSLLDPRRIPKDLEKYALAVKRAKRHIRLLDHAVNNGGWTVPKKRGAGRGIAVTDTDYYLGYPSATKAVIVDVVLDDDGTPNIERVYIAIDTGTVINPDIVRQQLEGGVAYALTTALMSEITIESGAVQQSNFNDYPILKMDQMPKVEIDVIPSDGPPLSVGEDSVPATIAALVNAIADAGGPRIRSMPIGDQATRGT